MHHFKDFSLKIILLINQQMLSLKELNKRAPTILSEKKKISQNVSKIQKSVFKM